MEHVEKLVPLSKYYNKYSTFGHFVYFYVFKFSINS